MKIDLSNKNNKLKQELNKQESVFPVYNLPIKIINQLNCSIQAV